MDIKKEANRLNYIVKGTLLPENTSVQEYKSIINTYTKRLWGNCEAYLGEEGFEELYNERVSR